MFELNIEAKPVRSDADTSKPNSLTHAEFDPHSLLLAWGTPGPDHGPDPHGPDPHDEQHPVPFPVPAEPAPALPPLKLLG